MPTYIAIDLTKLRTRAQLRPPHAFVASPNVVVVLIGEATKWLLRV